jgi:hypothetical protein
MRSSAWMTRWYASQSSQPPGNAVVGLSGELVEPVAGRVGLGGHRVRSVSGRRSSAALVLIKARKQSVQMPRFCEADSQSPVTLHTMQV